MKIGVSSASLYPLHAEDAFAELAALGVRCAELLQTVSFPVSIEISLVDRFTRNKVARYLSPCVKLGCRSDSR